RVSDRDQCDADPVPAAKALRGDGIGVTLIAIGDSRDVSTLAPVSRSGGGRFFNPKVGSEMARTLLGEATILAGQRPATIHPNFQPGPTQAALSDAVLSFLSRWAIPEGTEKDAVTGFPKRIRRAKDSMVMVLIPAGT